MIRRYLPQNTEELIHWYERYVSPVSLIAGFLLDNFVLLHRVDVIGGNLLLLFYLVVTGVCIVLINYIESGRTQRKILIGIAPFIPVVMQFALGGLFSGYLSLYSRSAGATVSWIFVLIFAFLLLANERFRTYYTKLTFQVSVYFGVLFSFLIFFLPLIVHRVGPGMFILSGLISAGLIGMFLALLQSLVPERMRYSQKATLRSLVIIYASFNILYFSNLIPPLPLALKDASVYHTLTRTGDVYRVQQEVEPWYVHYLNIPAVFHRVSNEPVYVYSAVFAPSGLTTSIRHQWQRYDQSLQKWITEADIQFPINGGREGGFRGYSEKDAVSPGAWRVNVLTLSGQIIGRVPFTVVSSTDTPMVLDLTQ